MLIAMNDSATGMPISSETVDPPNSSSAAICQDMIIAEHPGRFDAVCSGGKTDHRGVALERGRSVIS